MNRDGFRFARLAALALLATACAAPPPEPEALRPVRSELVLATGGGRVRSFSGRARAGQETNLSFRVPGRIQALNVKLGDAIRRGQVLAELEPDDFEIAVEQSRAELANAEATAENAEADLARIRGLFERDSLSRGQYDSALAQSKSARARVEAARQRLRSAERQRGYAVLKAPVEGSIAEVLLEVNENVSQGQTVVRMTSGSNPEVQVAVPGVLISQVREGSPAAVRFSALPGDSFGAVVTEVGVSSTGAATTFPVTVRLGATGPAIRPGMSAEVDFQFEQENGGGDRIFLPAYAVGEDRAGRYVFVLEPSGEEGVGVVRRVPVEVATSLSPGGRLEVLSGLDEGQRVVTAGVRRLTDGQRVKLPSDAGSA